jgi:hypothetical protein
MVTKDLAGSSGSSRFGRAVRGNGRRGEVIALQVTSYARERERESEAAPKRMMAALA